MKHGTVIAALVVATALEAGGDAIVRLGLHAAATPTRIFVMLIGAATLFCYGLILNLAPLDFGRLIGAYVAAFFIAAQIINLVVFRTAPSLPIIVGGCFIVTGGAIITLWRS
jgi:small multidrug resistance family-3 protein